LIRKLEGYETCFFYFIIQKPLLRILDVYPGSKNCSTCSFLTQKTCLYDIEEKKLIYDVHPPPPRSGFFFIPDPGSRGQKAPDPGSRPSRLKEGGSYRSGSGTLIITRIADPNSL
jgi:hypothetical protein